MPHVPWRFEELSQTPAVYPANHHPTPEGIRALHFDGLPYQGRPTRVFAYYGVPAATRKGERLPAMVLVHGGGATALADWVKLWNDRGYAAISMDTCGCDSDGTYYNADRPQHAWAGPRGWGGFEQIDAPACDHWTYHAVAAVVRAHSLIRSFPEVDPARIGITGVSWGGYLTCIASSIDPRFAFAAPVYGCGALRHDSVWQTDFEKMGEAKAKQWLDAWDPANYLPLSRTPMLWVTGTNDFAYPLSCLQKSYRLAPGPRTLSIRINMHHAHGGAGERPEEIFALADHLFRGGAPLVRVTSQGHDTDRIHATYEGEAVRAEIVFTDATGPWPLRRWEFAPADLDRSGKRASAAARGTACYLNLTDNRGLVVSTEHVERS